MKILLVCAVEAELANRALSSDLDVLITGIGPVEASYALSRHLAVRRARASSSYDLILNLGIAGAFGSSQLQPGATVLVDTEYYADLGREDHSPLTLPPGVACTYNIVIDFSAVPAFERVHQACLALGTTVGAGLTSAQITTTVERTQILEHRFPQARIETMEGFACARVAALYDTPFLELRGISNQVADSRSSWDIPAGLAGLHTVLDAILSLYGVQQISA